MKMSDAELDHLLRPVLAEIERQSRIAEHFVDKELYRSYVATLWAQLTLSPEDHGLSDDELEPLHDRLNVAISPVLGTGNDVRSCFRFINSRDGEAALARYRVPAHHRELLLYFCSIILDPDGHRRWAEEQRKR
jgi:hypothetical protein